MPLTSAEKMREYRKRLKKKGFSDELKKKDRERKRLKRQSLTSAQLRMQREKEKLNQRKCRNKVRCSTEGNGDEACISSTNSPYKSPATLKKAVKRVATCLPRSPRKCKKVVIELAAAHGVLVNVQQVKNHIQRLNPGTEEAVAAFYARDDISWQTPGMKDYVIVKDKEGVKSKIQKRYMIMTLKEAHAIFHDEFPDMPVKLAKFCALRPHFVCTLQDTPHNVCLCHYHENVKLLLKVINEVVPQVKTVFSDFISTIVCNQEKEVCMMSKCEKCAYVSLKDKYCLNENLQKKTIKWTQWQTVNQRITLKEIHGTVGHSLDALSNMLPKFLQHTFIKRQQSKFFENKKNSANKKNILVQVDFAENYTVQLQDEVQSAHWSKPQITLFTAYVWDSQNDGYSCAIVSDELDHNKYSVHAFLNKIMQHIISTNPEVETVAFMSDGAASQFKQRFLFANLTFFRERYGINCSWHFFATSHGKGVVDGIGGTVKRAVWNICKAVKHILSGDEDFAKIASERCRTINIFYISAIQIAENKVELDKLWTGIVPIEQTKSIHAVTPIAPYIIEYQYYSLSPQKFTHNFKKQVSDKADSQDLINRTALLQGDFALVSYAGKNRSRFFVGQVIYVEDGYEISFLRKNDSNGKIFTFPLKEDKCWVEKDQIEEKLAAPTIDQRNKYHFSHPISNAE